MLIKYVCKTIINFLLIVSGQVCQQPTPLGGTTSRFDLDLSPFIRLSRQESSEASQGVTHEDAKLACQVSGDKFTYCPARP